MSKLCIFILSENGKPRPYISLKIESAERILGLIQSDHAGYASFQFERNYFLVEQIKPTWSIEDIQEIRNLVADAFKEPLNENNRINFESQSWFNISRKIAEIYLKGHPLSSQEIFGIPLNLGFEKWYPTKFFQKFVDEYLELSQPRYLPITIKISLLSSSDTTNEQSVKIDPNTDKIIVTITTINNIIEAAPNTFPSYYPNPDTIDRTVSPNSFSNKTTLTIGQDGCEELMHNAIAERRFFFKEIVVGEKISQQLTPNVDSIRIAKLVTFSNSWYPLGHALGEIVYSLPLAPAEQVNIAVIDWKREDAAQRNESILYNEQLNHNQQRDRTIEETVEAALRERQSSQSSTIGGSVGVSAFGVGASVSAAHSWSNSEGNRNTSSNSLQDLSDSFQQASSNVRSMYSTVVIQTAQSEKSTAQTRTIRNYNHSHALTVLYYEVLRQYRIVNEISNSEDLLMVKFNLFTTDNLKKFYYLIKKIALNTDLFRTYESLLEPDLVYNDTDMPIDLNQNYLAGFNVTIKSKRIDDPTFQGDSDGRFPIYQSNYGIIYFLIETLEGKTFAKKMESYLNLKNSGYENEIEIELGYYIENKNWFQFDIINKNKASEWDVTNEVIPSINQIKSIGIFSAFHLGRSGRKDNNNNFIDSPNEISFRDSFWDGSPKIEWHLKAISVNALIDNSALQKELLNAKGEGDVPLFVFTKERKISYYVTTNITKPAGSDFPPAVQQKIVDKVKSRHNVEASLTSHLLENQDYYRRKIVEHLGPDYFAKILEQSTIGDTANTTLFDLVNPKPIEIIGEYVVFKFYPKPEVAAFQEGLRLDILNEKSEAFISLPTRGVFAETKLSHCNASEKIDETRFWKWEEHPIPDLAPQIAPVSTDSRNQTINTTPSQMPNSNLTIVNPPAAPDPTGLTSSLNLLGSLGAFNLAQGDQQNVNSAIQGNLNNVRRFAELNAQLEMQRRSQQQVDQNADRIREALRRGEITEAQANELQHVNLRNAVGAGIDSTNSETRSGNGTTNVDNTDGDSGSDEGNDSEGDTDEQIEEGDDDYDDTPPISYPVPLIAQPTPNSCWAASMAMLVSFRRGREVTPEYIAREGLGLDSEHPISLDEEHNWETIKRAKDHFGFEDIDLPSNASLYPSPEQWYNWLVEYGPLWVTITGVPSHAVVVRGIQGDLTPENTDIEINDPAEGGNQYVIPFSELAEVFGRLGLSNFGSWRVLYLPPDENANENAGENPDPPGSRSDTSFIVNNFYKSSDVVSNCRVEIINSNGTVLTSGITGSNGRLRLNINSISDGSYLLRVLPMLHTALNINSMPSLPNSIDSNADRIWETIPPISINISSHRIQNLSTSNIEINDNTVSVKLKPIWMRSLHYRTRPTGSTLDWIVVHRTGNPTTDRDIRDFTNPTREVSIHYIIGIDGHIIKMVKENDRASHAGTSWWAGRPRVNDFSIGIELTNHGTNSFPAVQYQNLITLLNSLVSHYHINRRNIIGHCDIGTNSSNPLILGRKGEDPGTHFNWASLVSANLSFTPLRSENPNTIYGGIFNTYPSIGLRQGDNDSGRIYGGTRRNNISTDVIREIQSDLLSIGYSCSQNGIFDQRTAKAVHVFQNHIFSGSLSSTLSGRREVINVQTALMIKNLRP